MNNTKIAKEILKIARYLICSNDSIMQINKAKKFKISSVKVVPIKKENKQQLDLVLEGCNLASNASNDQLWTMQDVKNTINGGYKNFFLLYDGEDAVGMCAISGNALSGFSIFSKYQGKGYGKMALEAIIKKMQQNNEEIVLRVAKTNTKAINLYKSFGFQIKDNDNYNDGRSYIMVLKK